MTSRLILIAAVLFGIPGFVHAAGLPESSFVAAVDRAISGGRLVQAEAMLARTDVTINAIDRRRLEAARDLAQHRDREAYAGFEALLGEAAGDCRLQSSAGVAALRLNYIEIAERRLREATSACPGDGIAWGALAVIEDRAGHWEASSAAYARALAIRPDDAALLNNAGMSLLAQRRISEAERIFRQALAIDPANERAKNNLDIARVSSGGRPTFDSEEDSLIRAERLNNAGYAALLAGDDASAAAYFAEAIKVSPYRFAKAEANLADVETPTP